MAKNTTSVELTPAEKAIKATLSRYASPVLLKKLEESKLQGTSKKVAILILEGRGEEVNQFKGETWIASKEDQDVNKAKIDQKAAKVTTPKVEKSESTPKVEKEVKEKTPKVKSEPKPKKEKIEIDEDDDKVKKILLNEESSKTEKITALLGLGYTCNQISKCSLKAHYSFCHTIQKNISLATTEKK